MDRITTSSENETAVTVKERKSLRAYCIEENHMSLLAQWDPLKNKDLTPDTVSHQSHKRIWWLCEMGHSWQAVVFSRTGGGAGCPYCAKIKSIEAASLASAYPQVAKQWHPTKNAGLSVSPQSIAPHAHTKIWWKCEKGHEWQAQVNSRVRGSGCPVCTNRIVKSGENDLATTHPILAKQWNHPKNMPLKPENFTAGSHAKMWWTCEKGHEWQASIHARSNGTGCPVCAGKTVVAGFNDLRSVFPQIAAQWHPTKNGNLFPEAVAPYSNRSVWWICERGHEYRSAISHRTSERSACPYCTGRKVIPGFNDLATKAPEIAVQWHKTMNLPLTPEMVTAASHKKVWWQCTDGHVWKAVIASRTGAKKCGCPVCAGTVKRSKRYALDAIV